MKTDLERLAELWRVESRYLDSQDRTVRPSPEVLCAVLRALGAPVERPSDAGEALRARQSELENRILEPVCVLSRDGGGVVPRGAGLEVGARVELTFTFEDGNTRRTPEEVGSEGIAIAPDLPEGYHKLEVEHSGGVDSCLLVAAPRRAYRAPAEEVDGVPPLREWGLFLPLHALRSEWDRGVGDLTDLERLREWVARMGGGAVGMLPLLACFLDEPLEPSPYAPVSRLFWNELYLDPTRLPEWPRTPAAQEAWADPAVEERIRQARGSRLVDYREAYRIQSRALQPLADAWHAAGGENGEDCRRFLEECPDAAAYATFRATVEKQGRTWECWPSKWRRDGIPAEAFDTPAFHRHLYAQLRFPEQLNGLAPSDRAEGGGLYLDLPLGAHPWGFDSWQHPESYVSEAGIGAPPDEYHAEGQNWGLLPIQPDAARATGHVHFRRMLSRLLPHARYLRIDHVMSLHRLYLVPDGRSAREGTYVRYPAKELYAILCLESRRHRTILVGEDLGTVPPETRQEMDERGVRRMYVVPFELDAEAPGGLNPIPDGVVASLNTHDLPTFAGSWRSESTGPALREAVGSDDAFESLVAFLDHLGRSPAGLVVVNLEDLWLEEHPQNVPGGADPASWRRRGRLSLPEFTKDPRVLEALRILRSARAAVGGNP